MIINCPHCGEKYSIDHEYLSRSEGNNRNGYGWNFKCCKCSKKWWLSALDATDNAEKILNINNNGSDDSNMSSTKKAENLGKLAKMKKQIASEKSKRTTRRFIDFALFLSVVFGATFLYYCYRENITNFILYKKKSYASKFSDLLVVYDVFFDISVCDYNTQVIKVCGAILNKYNNAVDVKCIEISIKENDSIIQEWSYIPDYGVIASGNVFNFEAQHEITSSSDDDITVEINVIHDNVYSKKHER